MGKKGRGLSLFAVIATAVGSVVIAVTAGPIAACVWFLVMFCFFRHVQKQWLETKAVDRMLDLLTKQCDPAGYIQAVTEWEKANPKSAGKQELLRANLAVAYFDDGKCFIFILTSFCS